MKYLLLISFLLVINGCNQEYSETERYWNKVNKAENKCESLITESNAKGYGQCLAQAGFQDGKPLIETKNPLREW